MRFSKSVHTVSLSLFLFWCCLRTKPKALSCWSISKNRKRGSNCTSSCQRHHLMSKLYSIIRENITACVKFTSPAGAQKPGGESDETCLMPPTGPVFIRDVQFCHFDYSSTWQINKASTQGFWEDGARSICAFF